jgi:hypothetical protein
MARRSVECSRSTEAVRLFTSGSHQASLACRDDTLPWLFLSERDTQMTQAFNYLIGAAASEAYLVCTRALYGIPVLGHRDPRHTTQSRAGRRAEVHDGLREGDEITSRMRLRSPSGTR